MRIPTEYIVFKVRDSRGRCKTGVFPVLDSEYQYHQSGIVIPTHISRELDIDALVNFLVRLYSTYVDLHYTYLEINPLVCMEAADGSPSIAFLDMAAKLDQRADYLCRAKWAIGRENFVAVNVTKTFADRGPPMVFPGPFGRDLTSLPSSMHTAGFGLWSLVAKHSHSCMPRISFALKHQSSRSTIVKVREKCSPSDPTANQNHLSNHLTQYWKKYLTRHRSLPPLTNHGSLDARLSSPFRGNCIWKPSQPVSEESTHSDQLSGPNGLRQIESGKSSDSEANGSSQRGQQDP
ncbi:citrate synthase [Puccinia graminis f. sp. tritici]|uniref:Citrate synthase n=1 Tax=Puccinia graminis f. sp. tritici TaxID=56615 RepID=A0A5B0M5X0_PUCGR|nr:citrate synthase [Puccinia graminis f. sp. tritici]